MYFNDNIKLWLHTLGGETLHTAFITSSGSVKTSGDNQFGQLGNESNINSNVFVDVSGITNAIAVSCGYYHTAFLLSDGRVKTVGDNFFGQLGNESNTNSYVPVDVVGITNAKAISCGHDFTAVLLDNGIVKAFGNNSNGQLGNGSTDLSSNVPIDVNGITNAIAISCGDHHMAILLSDKTVKMVGSNSEGQLGIDILIYSQIDVPVILEGLTDVVAISCGSEHSAFVLLDGTVKTVGMNEYGQLGNGTTENSYELVDVIGINNAVGVSCGQYHTLLILSNGIIKSFGRNRNGQLGTGLNYDELYESSLPIDVSGITTGIDVCCGGRHSLILLEDGTVRTFGRNNKGQLGNGTNIDSEIMVSVSGMEDIIITNINGKREPIKYKILNNMANPIKMMVSNRNPLIDIETSIENLSYSGVYASGMPYDNIISGITINAVNMIDNSNIMDFSSNNIILTMTLPLANISNTHKIFKRISGENNLMNPQPSNYPINMIYNLSNNRWRCNLPSLSDYFIMDEAGGTEIPCFTDKTDILTPNGYINITKLKENDKILTHDKRQVSIIKIYSFEVINSKHNNPYIIPKRSIDDNYPPEDVILSGKHLIRYKNGWIQPKNGFNGLLFKQDESNSIIKYYHIKLPNYMTDYLVINGGCVVESYGDNIPVVIKKRKGLYQIIVKK